MLTIINCHKISVSSFKSYFYKVGRNSTDKPTCPLHQGLLTCLRVHGENEEEED